MGEPSEKDGSFSVPAEQPTRHFTDAEVRRNYEYILTSTNLYPPELHSAVRSVLSEPPLNPDWSDKGRQIAALFTPYGDREYQGDFLYRTRLHGEDGISFFFDEGYTYIPWNGLAFLLDAMIEDGDYPNPVVEEQPDPIGDYNIPDEVDEMGGPHRQMTIGEADFDYVLDAVAYEAGETVVEPVKPQAIVQMENDTPAAGDEPASVPDENPPVVVEAPETALPTDTAEQPTPPPVKGNTTAHKNFRRFQELFPEIVSGQYEYLRLEAGEAYYPLVIHHKYGSHYCMEHYYMQNGDRMYDPYMDFQIDKEAGTLRAFSYENSGIGVYNEADPDDPAYEKAINGFNSFFATWLNNIRSQGYEPVRASMMVNDEEVDVDLRPTAEAVPVVEEEQPEQLSLLSLEKSTEDLLIERVMCEGPIVKNKKERIYQFAQTHPTGSAFVTFLKEIYGYEGFSLEDMGVKYAMFNGEGVSIEWQDEQGETQETKLSWARAAGVVQRLVDEGRYPDIPAVYVDTGLEYPELRDFVKTKDNVIWLRPRYPFTQILEKYGYPIISKEVSDVINGARKGQPYRLARLNGELLDKNGKKSIYNCENYKYLLDAPFKISARCCYHMKKAPLNKFERQSGRHPITGVLACESKLREQSWIKFGCNGFERQRPLSQPLAFWLEEDILRYLKMTGIPYAPIYGDIVESRKKNGTPILKTTGVSRSGCMYCMYGVHLEHEPNRFQLMQVTHPQQYDYCINKLGCGAVLDYIGVPYRNQQLEVDHC